MDLNQLNELLPDALYEEPCERTEECLGLRSLYDLAKRPSEAPEDDRRHLMTCSFCRDQVARLRRHRDIINAPDDRVEPADNANRALAYVEQALIGPSMNHDQLNGAIDDATRAIDMVPNESAYRIRAVAYALAERYAEAVNDIHAASNLASSVSSSEDPITLTGFYTDDPHISNVYSCYVHTAQAVNFLHQRRASFAHDVSDYAHRIASLVNMSAAGCPGGCYVDVPLYRICTARILRAVIDQTIQRRLGVEHDEWPVASTAVGRLALIAVSQEQQVRPDRHVLNLALAEFWRLDVARKENRYVEPEFFTYSVLGALSLFENVDIDALLLAERDPNMRQALMYIRDARSWLGETSPSAAILRKAS